MTSPALLTEPAAATSEARHALTITPYYPSQGNPVAGCFIAEPLAHLEKIGVRHTVFAADPFYRPATITHPNFPAERTRFFCLPKGVGLPSAGTFLSNHMLDRVRTLHHSHPIDLIHAHSALPCGYAALLLSKKLEIPFVVTVHGLDASSRRQVGGASGWLCERLSRKVYSDAARVICVSEKVQREVRRIDPGANTIVVYNGVDCEYFRPPESTADSQVVLAIGNLIDTKGFDCLLRALAMVHHEIPNARCRIIGEGPKERHLKRLAHDLGCSDSIEWLGRQGRPKVANFLRSCAVFALPSTYEALGCVYLEAMATGKPVIGCRGQGIDEVIRHGINGLLIDPENHRGLAQQLLRLLRDANLRHSTGNAARETIRSGFTLQHQAERLSQVYEECLS